MASYTALVSLLMLLFCSRLLISRVDAQNNGDVRLVNGPTSNVGRVEIYYDGQWGTLCDDSWHLQDANVICRQAGFADGASQVVYQAGFGEGTGPIWVDQIRCNGNEQSILECTHNGWGIHDCRHREDAGVHCERKVAVKPAHMPVRLACPGNTQDGTCTVCPHKQHPDPEDCTAQVDVQGIVMALYNNEWKPVTAEGWNMRSAHVACGELGYPLALGIPTLEELWTNWNGVYCANSVGSGSVCSSDEISENDAFRESLRSMWLKDLECSGKERRTLDCFFSEFGPQVNPRLNVATVKCGFQPHSGCSSVNPPETYRTRGSSVPWKGRVEVNVAGEWGTVCDNQWSFEDANVVCRAMGYGTARNIGYRANYGRGVGKIHYSRLICQGDEETLSNCTKVTGYLAEACGHQGDAGLECNVPQKCEEPKKGRITTIPDPINTGYQYDYIEVNGESGWGSLCFESLKIHTANVICRENREVFALRIRSGNRQSYSGVRYKGFITCTGDEMRLEECSVSLEAVLSCNTGDSIVDCSSSLPDLVPDLSSFETSLRYFPYVDRQPMYYLRCAHEERCLSSSADGKPYDHVRHLLRFNSQTMNYGMMDFLPVLQSHEWIWHSCHNHFHSFEAFIHYDLLNVTTREKVAEGHKASFCLEDSFCEDGSPSYNCGTGIQGISVNCGDLYGRHLDCQWIDITDVPPGTYILRQCVNPDRLTMETDYGNNKVECLVNYYPGFYLYPLSCKLSDH